MEAKNNRDIASLISVSITFVSLILVFLATLFSRYSAHVSEREKEIVTSNNIIINYIDGNEVKIKNIEPGSTVTYNFEISSKEDATGLVDYRIYFVRDETNFNDQYIFYRISGSSSMKNDPGSVIGFELRSFENYNNERYRGSVKPGETQKYILQFYYSSNVAGSKNYLNGTLHVDQIMDEK